MNSFVIDIFERIAKESAMLVPYRKSKTLTEREINTACRLIIPGELKVCAINEGLKHLGFFMTSSQKRNEENTSEESSEDEEMTE
jgi:histone H2B